MKNIRNIACILSSQPLKIKKKMNTRLIVILATLWIWSNSVYCQNENIVLKTNLNGEVIFGSIENLITQIQNGKSVRVGWQHDLDKDSIPDLEHWIDAKFISILNGPCI